MEVLPRSCPGPNPRRCTASCGGLPSSALASARAALGCALCRAALRRLQGRRRPQTCRPPRPALPLLPVWLFIGTTCPRPLSPAGGASQGGLALSAPLLGWHTSETLAAPVRPHPHPHLPPSLSLGTRASLAWNRPEDAKPQGICRSESSVPPALPHRPVPTRRPMSAGVHPHKVLPAWDPPLSAGSHAAGSR